MELKCGWNPNVPMIPEGDGPIAAVAPNVEHTDVGPDVRLFLLRQSGGDE